MSLFDDILRAAEAPAPKDFKPGITYAGRDLLGAKINTDAIPPVETEAEWEAAVRDMGIHIPDGYTLRLVRAELAGSSNEAAWHRGAEDKGANHTAYTKPATVTRWRYQFEVVLKSARADEDFAALMKEARKAKVKPRPVVRTGLTRTIGLADFQAGKTDVLGGSLELLMRSEQALAEAVRDLKADGIQKVILVDLGDSTEGFESSPNADRTNDLSQAQQIRFWRRVLWRWIDAIVDVVADLEVVSVPSNHCRVRRGKQTMGDALDDWGIDCLAQVADIAAGNPERYGHIRFTIPREHEEFVILPLGDRTIGFEHGHQVGQPNQIADHLKKNGRRGIGSADYICLGHFHHLRIQMFGDEQMYFLHPTNDSGSSWFAASGERSRAGVLANTFDAAGEWLGPKVYWTS